MIKNSTKKIILGATAFVFLFSTAFVTAKKAHAQYTVYDPVNYVENVLNYVENSVTAEATLGENIQDTVLNKIATAIAKQLLMQITESVVNWINSGFNGNPSFIQNPAAFFQNVGDQATGAFIAQNGPLSALCSPFSLQVRLAIVAQAQLNNGYNTGSGNRYSCTLSTIIQNGTNAVKGASASASIQGFINGDFSQGGWPAFTSLIVDPQNTPNGAYLLAQDQLQSTIAAQTAQKQNELNQGGGFLSWETCTPSNGSAGASAADVDDPYNVAAENDPNQNCQIQTPGSVISATLNKHLAVPTENLELANSINDIINAAFSELVVMALQNGLTSVSKSSSSNGGASYLQNAVASANTQSFASTQSQMTTTIQPYLTNANALAQNYTTAYGLIQTASSTFAAAESCYAALANSANNSSAIPYFQGQIANIQTIVASSVTPLAANLFAQYSSASSSAIQYQTMYGQITSAKTLADLAGPNQTLNDLSQTGGFPTNSDVQSSKTDLTNDATAIAPLQEQASTSLQQCQSFNYSGYTATGSQ